MILLRYCEINVYFLIVFCIGVSFNAGVAAGAAVVMTVVVMIISLVSRRLIKDEGYEL